MASASRIGVGEYSSSTFGSVLSHLTLQCLYAWCRTERNAEHVAPLLPLYCCLSLRHELEEETVI